MLYKFLLLLLLLICLSETRINDEPSTDISITGYSFVHVSSHLTAGGVAVYIS